MLGVRFAAMFLFVLHCAIIVQPVQARIIEVKTVGKIRFAVVLATLAVGVKFWQHTDLSKLKNQRSQLLLTEIEPQIFQFNRGFDNWRIESYGKSQLWIRNGVWLETR